MTTTAAPVATATATRRFRRHPITGASGRVYQLTVALDAPDGVPADGDVIDLGSAGCAYFMRDASGEAALYRVAQARSAGGPPVDEPGRRRTAPASLIGLTAAVEGAPEIRWGGDELLGWVE
jgi:hypothetical protein